MDFRKRRFLSDSDNGTNYSTDSTVAKFLLSFLATRLVEQGLSINPHYEGLELHC